jgi:hypothetical protein
MDSDAYATGSSLVTLHEAGMSAADPCIAAAWSGFPYGVDQYISTAAMNRATLALIHAAR